MTIHLHDKRREAAEWLPKIQHAIGGVPLLLSGVHHLSEESERPIALLEIAIAVVVLGALAKELHAVRRRAKAEVPPHSALGWFDLAAGAMLIFEAFHGAVHKPGYLRPQFLSGVVTIGLGLFHARLHAFQHHRRYVKLDEDGLEYRGGPFRRLAVRWADLECIQLSPAAAAFHWTDGRQRTLKLTRYRNAEALHRAIADQAGAARVRIEA